MSKLVRDTRNLTILLTLLSGILALAMVLIPILTHLRTPAQIMVQAIFGVVAIVIVICGAFFGRRQELALRWSEERYRLVDYATNDVVWDWDLATGRIDWSQSLQRAFGYHFRQADLDAAWWEEHIHPDERQKVMTGIRQAIDGRQEFWSKEYRFQRADGSYAHVFDRGYVILDEQGIPGRMIGAMMDITEWRRAEQELESERNLLRTLVDQLPDRIYVKDTGSRFLLKNLADARAMQAKTTQELVGKTDFDYYPRELAEQYYADDQVVIKSGEPLLNREEPGLGEDGERRWVLTTKMPLKDKQGQIVGLVGIGHDITNRKKVENALQQANQQLTEQIDELERRSREMARLNEMGDLLQSCTTEKEAYSVAREASRLLFPEESGGMYTLNPSRDTVELVASWGGSAPQPGVFRPDDCWALRLGRLHLVEEWPAENDPAGDQPRLVCNHVGEAAPESLVCVPLVAQGETLGLLHIRHDRDPAAAGGERRSGPWFDEAKQQLTRTVASSVALALANLRLRETLRQQSIRDPLTGLFNRRYMEETIERELRRVGRNQDTLGVIMLDIDHFKRFNDAHGHEAGDLVLREISALLRALVRGEDIPCRYGGEEFILIMPGAPLKIVRERAAAVQESIRRLNLRFHDQPLAPVTVSLGIASYPEHGSTAESVIRAADGALRRAKRAGRDRIVSASTPPAGRAAKK
jgi:diguanylate cyclase (GGDEF)-like protein/PAS domain S-box-containing protein